MKLVVSHLAAYTLGLLAGVAVAIIDRKSVV